MTPPYALLRRPLIALLFLASACATKPPLPPWPVFSETLRSDPAAIASALDQRTPAWKSAQAEVVLRIEGLSESPPSLKGDLLLQRPGLARLRTYTPLGTIAFDLLYRDENVELYLPHRRELVLIQSKDLSKLSLGKMPIEIPSPKDLWTMVQPWPGLKEEKVNIAPSSDPLRGQLLLNQQTFEFEWDTGRITRVTFGKERRFDYSDWNWLEGRDVACLVRVSEGKFPMFLLLKIATLHADIPLLEQAFAPVDRSQLKVTTIK